MFQDGIWSVLFQCSGLCENSKKKEKKNWKKTKEEKKRKKEFKEKKNKKEKCQKEENKKGSHQILRSEV